MFNNKSDKQNDLDSFWDNLIEKSSWAKKNSSKFNNEFKNLEILDSKPIKSDKINETINANQANNSNYKKIIIAVSIFAVIMLSLVIFFAVRVLFASSRDAKCDNGVWSISKGKCVATVDYCNKTYALNSTYSENGCHCLDGFVKEENNCVKAKDCSKSGNVYIGADNTCKCSNGYIMQDDKCVSYYEDCNQKNAFFDGKINLENNKPVCKCKTNNFWNIEKNKCESCTLLKDKSFDIKNQCQITNKTTSTSRIIDSLIKI